MCDSSYYPAGAYNDPNAPYNQVEPPEIEYDASAVITLNKEDKVLTDKVYCEDGDYELCDGVTAHEVWDDNYMDIPELLEELIRYVNNELKCNPPYDRRHQLQLIKDSAQGWVVIDEEYEIEH